MFISTRSNQLAAHFPAELTVEGVLVNGIDADLILNVPPVGDGPEDQLYP
jgi:hypothetical protein